MESLEEASSEKLMGSNVTVTFAWLPEPKPSGILLVMEGRTRFLRVIESNKNVEATGSMVNCRVAVPVEIGADTMYPLELRTLPGISP